MGRAVDRLPHDRRVIDHHDQDEDGGDEREAFEENRERIGRVEIPEAGRGGCAAVATERSWRQARRRGRAMAAQRQRAFVDLLGERFDHQHEQAEDERRRSSRVGAPIIITSAVK